MEHVAVEEDHSARTHLARLASLARIREAVRLTRRVESCVVVGAHGVEDACAVRAGVHPEAAVVHVYVFDRKPRADQRAIARRDVVLVLVPRLARLSRALDEIHALHRLDVRSAQELSEHRYDAPVPQRRLQHR